MKPLEIDVEADRVTIEHQVVMRPPHISRSVWLDLWERVEEANAYRKVNFAVQT